MHTTTNPGAVDGDVQTAQLLHDCVHPSDHGWGVGDIELCEDRFGASLAELCCDRLASYSIEIEDADRGTLAREPLGEAFTESRRPTDNNGNPTLHTYGPHSRCFQSES